MKQLKLLKLLILWLLFSFGLAAYAQSDSVDEELMMKRANEIGAFIKQNNAQGVVDYTDDAVKNLIGREAFFTMTRAAMETIKNDGTVIKDLQFQKPWPEIQGHNRVFRFIPKLQTMSIDGRTGKIKGFFLAVKNSDGVWKFVEGSGLVKNPKFAELLYPDLPKLKQFPEVTLEVVYGSK